MRNNSNNPTHTEDERANSPLVGEELQTKVAIDRKFSEIAHCFNQFTLDTIDYNYIAEQMLHFSGAKYAVLNVFDENGEGFTTMALAGMNRHFQKASKLLGFAIVGKRWGKDPQRASRIKQYKTTIFQTLSDLTGTVLFSSPKKGSDETALSSIKGPRSMSPTFVCIFTTILFAGTASL